jgi:hypothetical protein
LAELRVAQKPAAGFRILARGSGAYPRLVHAYQPEINDLFQTPVRYLQVCGHPAVKLAGAIRLVQKVVAVA